MFSFVLTFLLKSKTGFGFFRMIGISHAKFLLTCTVFGFNLGFLFRGTFVHAYTSTVIFSLRVAQLSDEKCKLSFSRLSSSTFDALQFNSK